MVAFLRDAYAEHLPLLMTLYPYGGAKYIRSTPDEAHILRMYLPLPNFSVPLPR